MNTNLIFRIPLHWQILIAIAIGALAGYLAGPEGSIFGVSLISIFDFLGSLFINLLKMLVVPLIVSSVITGVAGIGSARDLGRLGGKTLLFYVLTTLIAVLIALTLLNIVRPGIVDGEPARELLRACGLRRRTSPARWARRSGKLRRHPAGHRSAQHRRGGAQHQAAGPGVLQHPVRIFPRAHCEPEHAKPVLGFWQGMFQVMMRMTEFVMRLAPIGVFGLAAPVVAKPGFGARALAGFRATRARRACDLFAFVAAAAAAAPRWRG